MHLVYAIDHLGSGGAQRQVTELAACLARRHGAPPSRDPADPAPDRPDPTDPNQPGLRTSVLVYHPHDFFADRLRLAGVRVVRIPKRGRLDPTLPLRIARHLRAEHATLVHAFLVGPALWSLLAVRSLGRGRPALVAAERAGRIGASALDLAAERVVYRGADAATVNAAPMADALRDRLGVPAERIHYLPNGIDLEDWDRRRAAACPLPLEPGRFHLGVVGRLEPQKNHPGLFDALARLGPGAISDWRVWCIGAESGEAAWVERLRGEVAARGLAEVVRFVPPQREIAAVMERLDALVLPSLWEGFPNVLLEAMATGLPSVAAPVGDVPSLVVDGDTALLAPPDDPAAWADALRRLHALSPEARRAMGARARAAVEAGYRIEDVADRHLALYEQIVAPRRL